ncbi:MAG: serine/threonine-protein kinase [Candidatus Eremiobacterota bacterium]
MRWLALLLALAAPAAAEPLLRQVTFVTDPPGAQVYLEVSGQRRYERFLGPSGQALRLDLTSLRGVSHYRVTFRREGYRDRTDTVPLYYQGRWPEQGVARLEPASLSAHLVRNWPWLLGMGLTSALAVLAFHRRTRGGQAANPTRIGPWVLGEELGRGGLSTVYRATSQRGEVAAVKVLHPDRDGETRERFRREVLAWRRLRHPNIVPLYDYGEDGDRLYLAMECVDGGTLRERIPRGGLGADEARAWLLALMDAVACAHDAGVVHRDLKPENVLITAGGVLKLTDFGLARPLEVDTLTRTGAVLGTLAYVAPERIGHNHDPDPRSDQYALGVIAYELFTGHKPYPERDAIQVMLQQINRPAPSLANSRGDLHPAVVAVVDRMLQRDPEGRFASVTAAREALIEAGVQG